MEKTIMENETLVTFCCRAACVTAVVLAFVMAPTAAWASSGTLVISSNTMLTEDHFGNILITGNKITLDCNGHVVIGPGVPGFNGGIEVAGGLSGVTVRRCKVTGFGVNGIFVGGGGIDGRYEDNITYGNQNHGIHVDGASGCLVLNNTSRSNGAIGIVLTGATRSWILHNTVEDNINWAGIALFDGSHDNVLLDNTARRNSDGYILDVVQNNELRLNRAISNSAHGFFIRDSQNDLVDSNTANQNLIGFEFTEGSNANNIQNNVADLNASDGFRVFMSDKNNLTGNTANSNGNVGFIVFGGASFNVLSRNTGHKNIAFDAYDEDSGTGNIWKDNRFDKTFGF